MRNWLLDRRSNLTSQFGEDGITQALFEALGPGNKSCVEIGAWDGIKMSNTRRLVTEFGWSGVMIECDEVQYPRLEETYRDVPSVTCVRAMVTREETLDHVLARTPLPTRFDLLSLDIDGSEYWVWAELRRYRPRVALVEFNPSFGPSSRFIPRRDTLGFGTSMQSLVDIGRSKGYELAVMTDVNCIFVTAEEYPKLNLPVWSSEQHWAQLWSGVDNPWVPQCVSDYDGRHYLVRPGLWKEGQSHGFFDRGALDDASYDALRDHAESPPVEWTPVVTAVERGVRTARFGDVAALLDPCLSGAYLLPTARPDIHTTMWRTLAECYLQTGDLTALEPTLRHGATRCPDEPWFVFTLSHLLLETGRAAEATACLHASPATVRALPEWRRLLAEAEQRTT